MLDVFISLHCLSRTFYFVGVVPSLFILKDAITLPILWIAIQITLFYQFESKLLFIT